MAACGERQRRIAWLDHAVLFALGLKMLLPASASAQVAQPAEGVSVADRNRPELRPIGGRLGSFFLYPTTSVVTEVSDNVRATQTDRRGDTIALLSGQATLRSAFSRHALNARMFVDQSLHARLTTENVARYGAQVDGFYDVSRDTRILASVRAERNADPRTSFNNVVGSRNPVQFDRYNASLTAQQRLGRIDFAGTFSWTAFTFDAVPLLSGGTLDQRFRDAAIYNGALSVGYRLRPGMTAIVRATGERVDYDLGRGDPRQPLGLDRNSKGARIEGGVRFDLTSLLYGEVRGGYLSRDYADATLKDNSGFSFGADLLWNVTPLTSLRFAADRRIDEAASTTIVGNRTTVAELTVDHELRRNVILSLRGQHATIEPIGGSGSTKDVFVSAGAKYFANRQLSFRANYRHARREAPQVSRGFRENRASIGAYLTF